MQADENAQQGCEQTTGVAQQLEWARQQLRTLTTWVDQSPIITLAWQRDARRTVEYVSANIRQFGYTPDELISGRTPLSALIVPDDRDQVRAQITECITNQQGQCTIEHRLLTPTGAQCWVENHTYVHADGDTPRLVSYLLDITARKAAEDSLISTEERLWSLFESAPVPIAISSGPEQATVAVNKEFTHLFGYTQEDMPVAEDWWCNAYPDPEYRRTVIAAWDVRIGEAIRNRSVIAPLETRVTCKDGGVRQVLFHASSIGSWNIIIGIDYTELRTAERAMQESEAKFRTLADTAAVAILIADAEGNIRYANPYLARVSGYAPDALPQQSFIQLIDPPHRQALRELLRDAQGTLDNPAKCTVRTTQGCWFEISAVPIEYEGQRATLVTAYDITTVHELQQWQEDLLHIVSHDLRNPLSIIYAHVQLMEQQDISEQQRERIAAIERGVQRINAMIGDLVDSARFEGHQLTLHPQRVALHVFVDDLLMRAEKTMAVEHIEVAFPPDLPPVMADFDRLERIFMNLLSNALKYSTPGTPICIDAQRQGDAVVIALHDQGPGIASDDLQHIFDRFYRTQHARKSEGTGLGLYITRLLVEAHGGRIWAESVPGEGSTFYFTLPIAS